MAQAGRLRHFLKVEVPGVEQRERLGDCNELTSFF